MESSADQLRQFETKVQRFGDHFCLHHQSMLVILRRTVAAEIGPDLMSSYNTKAVTQYPSVQVAL